MVCVGTNVGFSGCACADLGCRGELWTHSKKTQKFRCKILLRMMNARTKKSVLATFRRRRPNACKFSRVIPGVESEPFIVFDPDDENQTQMLISVTERYLLEKDLNGTLVEVLDLKCLQVGALVTVF